MDFHCIEMLLDLPAFRVTGVALYDHQLALHLQRKEWAIVCPRCGRVCERIKVIQRMAYGLRNERNRRKRNSPVVARLSSGLNDGEEPDFTRC